VYDYGSVMSDIANFSSSHVLWIDPSSNYAVYNAAGVSTLSDINAVITIVIRLRSDYDISRAPASIRREQKMNMSIFRRIVVS